MKQTIKFTVVMLIALSVVLGGDVIGEILYPMLPVYEDAALINKMVMVAIVTVLTSVCLYKTTDAEATVLSLIAFATCITICYNPSMGLGFVVILLSVSTGLIRAAIARHYERDLDGNVQR